MTKLYVTKPAQLAPDHLVTHVQTCDDVRVRIASEWTASVPCDDVPVQIALEWTASAHTLTHVQTCDDVLVQTALEWTASVHLLSHMSKPVMTFVFKLLWYIL